MKILHLIKSLGRGGPEMLLPSTISVHDRHLFEFAVGYFVPEKNQVVPLLEEQGCQVQCFPTSTPYLMPGKVLPVATYARQIGADLIHCHLPLSGVVGRMAGRLTGIPVVYTEHNLQERYHPLTRRANLQTMNWNQRVLAVSDEVRTSLINRLGSRSVPIQTLRNGVNTLWYDPATQVRDAVRSQMGISTEAVIIGTVAVFRRQKRLDRWLRIAAILSERFPKLLFLLVGTGPEAKALKEQARRLGLEKVVIFPGRLEDVRPSLAAMDIYLMTSEYEGLPVALLEAMSMELAVVATDVGGIPEVVRGGVDGLLAGPEAIDQLTDHLAHLVENSTLRREYGRAARQRVLAAYTIEHMVAELEKLYREILGAKVQISG